MEGGADRRARWTGECPIVQLQVDKVVPLKHPCVRLPVRSPSTFALSHASCPRQDVNSMPCAGHWLGLAGALTKSL